MTPSANNEIRDLQPVVQALALRFGFFLSGVLLVSAAVAFLCSILVLTVGEEVWAVTSSGRPFRITPVSDELAEELLKTPGGRDAVVGARAVR